MRSLKLDHADAGVTQMHDPILKEELARMKVAAGTLYADPRASMNLPLDDEHRKEAQRLAKKHKGAALLIVVGIGGSNLGTMAVQEAVLGKHHNLFPGKRPQVLYADTIDPIGMARIEAALKAALKSRKRVVINAISKSGTTTETIANLEVLLAPLKRARKNWKDMVVITTDAGSKLDALAHDLGLTRLHIPKQVGGRFSVLSHVGLFPLGVLGIDTKALLDGAAHMRAKCLREKDNPAMLRASMLFQARVHGRNIADNFYFAPDLESVGKWYRQLMGESIGKEYNTKDERVWMGITPTVSIGSTDLHSMAQLYFGGPQDKFHTLVRIEQTSKLCVPKMREFEPLVPNIQGQPLAKIMDAIAQSVASVLRAQKRPHCTITLPGLDEESLGALLQLHMMEMMYLAALLDVNAFDQPNVEEYKIETKRRLAR